jgi:hypothetical protein
VRTVECQLLGDLESDACAGAGYDGDAPSRRGISRVVQRIAIKNTPGRGLCQLTNLH